jgi:prolyl oligopeptidase
LEGITSERSLAWVREQNAATVRELGASGDFETLRQRLLAILDSKERIPHVDKHGARYYNFWRDATHVRGVATNNARSIRRRIRMGNRA